MLLLGSDSISAQLLHMFCRALYFPSLQGLRPYQSKWVPSAKLAPIQKCQIQDDWAQILSSMH